MEWVTMSQQELRKVEIIAQASDGRITRKLAAETLHISERQVYRLVSRYRTGDASALAHSSRRLRHQCAHKITNYRKSDPMSLT